MTAPMGHTERIAEATALLAVARRELEQALSQLETGSERANKTIITAALRVAFDKVAHAQQHLEGVLQDR